MKIIKIFKRHNLHFSFLRIKFCLFCNAFPLVLGSQFSLSEKFQIYNENSSCCYKYIQISQLLAVWGYIRHIKYFVTLATSKFISQWRTVRAFEVSCEIVDRKSFLSGCFVFKWRQTSLSTTLGAINFASETSFGPSTNNVSLCQAVAYLQNQNEINLNRNKHY